MSIVTGMTQAAENTANIRETQDRRIGRQNGTEAAEKAERAREKEKSVPGPQAGCKEPNVDEYVHEGQPESAGLYQLTRDGEGNPKIVFDDPDRRTGAADESGAADQAGRALEEKADKADPDTPKDEEEETRCTVNTDRVDEEIKRLQQKKSDIERQLSSAADDPEKSKRLENELSRIEAELQTKDTDSYRRRNADYTYG